MHGNMETLRARNAQSGPFGTIFPGAGGDGDYASGAGQDELKVLVDGYKGFGMLSLIRVLIFRDFRSFLLAVIGILLLVGQWAGPVGFIAFKLESEDISACDGDGGIWAKFIMISVAMIYFARLSLTALSHKEEMPVAFEAYKMPKWWGLFRHADLIVTWLVYDTFIFLANLLIVFQDRRVEQMVVDVLALEFFTIIDDEFKSALIAFDSSFLRDIATATQSPEAGHDDCCDVAGHVVGSPLKGVLLIARAICRVGGPLCAFVMIFYGPICLGSPDGQAG